MASSGTAAAAAQADLVSADPIKRGTAWAMLAMR